MPKKGTSASRGRAIQPAQSHVDVTPRHCVRCHSEYTPQDGTLCIIPHIFDWDRPQFVGTDPVTKSTWNRYPSVCCCGEVRVTIQGENKFKYEGERTGMCFRGRHTASVDDVEYNYASVRPCFRDPDSDGRCIRDILGLGAPVFEDTVDEAVKWIEDQRHGTR